MLVRFTGQPGMLPEGVIMVALGLYSGHRGYSC
jgi:hypothetical protein